MPTCAPAEKAALMAYEIAAALEPPKPLRHDEIHLEQLPQNWGMGIVAFAHLQSLVGGASLKHSADKPYGR